MSPVMLSASVPDSVPSRREVMALVRTRSTVSSASGGRLSG